MVSIAEQLRGLISCRRAIACVMAVHLLVTATPSCAQDLDIPLTWESDIGTAVTALFIGGTVGSNSETSSVTLQRADGRRIIVSFSRLNASSRRMARELIEWQKLQVTSQVNSAEDGAEVASQLIEDLRYELMIGNARRVQRILASMSEVNLAFFKDLPELEYISGGQCFENSEAIREYGMADVPVELKRQLQIDAMRILGVTGSRIVYRNALDGASSNDSALKAIAQYCLRTIEPISDVEKAWSRHYRHLVSGGEYLVYVPELRVACGLPEQERSVFLQPQTRILESLSNSTSLYAAEIDPENRSFFGGPVELAKNRRALEQLVRSHSATVWFFEPAESVSPLVIDFLNRQHSAKTIVRNLSLCRLGFAEGRDLTVVAEYRYVTLEEFQRKIGYIFDPSSAHPQGSLRSVPAELLKVVQMHTASGAPRDSRPDSKDPSAMNRARKAVDFTSFRGSWRVEGQHLVGDHKSACQLEFSAQGGYRFETRVEKEGQDALVFLLPAGSHNFQLLLDTENGKFHGLANIDGMYVDKNGTGINARDTPVSRDCHVVIQVGLTDGIAKIDCRIDGKTIIDWKGNVDRLGTVEGWVCPNRDHLGVATANARVRLHSMQFQRTD